MLHDFTLCDAELHLLRHVYPPLKECHPVVYIRTTVDQ